MGRMGLQEMAGLESKLGTSETVIEVDTERCFNVTVALNKLRAEYEAAVQKHREEAGAYYTLKVRPAHRHSWKYLTEV